MGEKAAGWSAGLLAAALVFAVLHAGLRRTPEAIRAADVPRAQRAGAPALPPPAAANAPRTVRLGEALGDELPARSSRESLSPDQLFAAASPAVAVVEVKDRAGKSVGQGSGFFVSADGLLVTNYHVIEGGHAATVRTYGGGQFEVAGVVATDRGADLAVLALSSAVGRNVAFLVLSDAPLPAIGTRVFAIGNPFGLTNTLSDGLVSGVRAVGDPKQPLTLLQISAPVGPGSSGGPLLSAEAHVIGVTTSGMRGGQNLNFAVPAEHVWRLLAARGAPRPIAAAAPPLGEFEGIDALARIVALLDRGQYGDALAALDTLAERHGQDPRFWMMRAVIHERGYRNYAAAEDAYRRALALEPAHRDAQYCFAAFLTDRRRYAEALDVYRALSKQEPDHPAPYLSGARVAARMGDHARAVTLFDLAFARDKEPAPTVRFERGLSLAAVGRDDAAMADFEAALRGQPATFVAPRLAIGDLHVKHGRLAEARRTFAEVARQWPKEAHAHFQLGVIAHREGDPAAARAAWNQAVACDRYGRIGNAARRLLATLQSTNISVTPGNRR